MPDFVPRSSWGSSFGLNGNIYIPPATYTDVSHLIVHHSAGTNTSSNWSGVVASIFDFHVNTNGWQDVGYNWLIDPNGIIYEGRGGGNNVRGAHMCGYNNNTMGVCILGTYSNTSPTQQSIDGIKSLLAWKSCLEDIDPVGSSQITSYPGFMKHISGHKDGCAPNYTECPGSILYSLLDSIRNSTKYLTDDVCISSSSSADTDEILKIFPNPATEKIFLEFESENKFSVIKIFDFTGKLILNVDIKNEKHLELDLSSLAPGYYIIKLICPDNIFAKSLIRI